MLIFYLYTLPTLSKFENAFSAEKNLVDSLLKNMIPAEISAAIAKKEAFSFAGIFLYRMVFEHERKIRDHSQSVARIFKAQSPSPKLQILESVFINSKK